MELRLDAMANSRYGMTDGAPVACDRTVKVSMKVRRTRPSAEGNYVSVIVTFTCPSREKYEAVHAALRADPDIRWTL